MPKGILHVPPFPDSRSESHRSLGGNVFWRAEPWETNCRSRDSSRICISRVLPIIASNPKGVIAEGLRAATPEGRAAFFNLSYVGLPDDFDPASDPDAHALAIFQTNAVAAGDMVGIFPRMARLNHGCVRAFNSVYSWREREGALVVHALKPIAKGEVSGFWLWLWNG